MKHLVVELFIDDCKFAEFNIKCLSKKQPLFAELMSGKTEIETKDQREFLELYDKLKVTALTTMIFDDELYLLQAFNAFIEALNPYSDRLKMRLSLV